MPSRIVSKKHYNRPWRARVTRDYVEYFLGYFATKEEALEREREFDRVWPPKRKMPRRNAEDPVANPGRYRKRAG